LVIFQVVANVQVVCVRHGWFSAFGVVRRLLWRFACDTVTSGLELHPALLGNISEESFR
jgi:hypothetical protein